LGKVFLVMQRQGHVYRYEKRGLCLKNLRPSTAIPSKYKNPRKRGRQVYIEEGILIVEVSDSPK